LPFLEKKKKKINYFYFEKVPFFFPSSLYSNWSVNGSNEKNKYYNLLKKKKEIKLFLF